MPRRKKCLETEKPTPALSKWVYNQRRKEQAHTDPDRHLDHSETQAGDRGILAARVGAITALLQILPDLIRIVDTGDQGARGGEPRRHEDEDTG